MHIVASGIVSWALKPSCGGERGSMRVGNSAPPRARALPASFASLYITRPFRSPFRSPFTPAPARWLRTWPRAVVGRSLAFSHTVRRGLLGLVAKVHSAWPQPARQAARHIPGGSGAGVGVAAEPNRSFVKNSARQPPTPNADAVCRQRVQKSFSVSGLILCSPSVATCAAAPSRSVRHARTTPRLGGLRHHRA